MHAYNYELPLFQVAVMVCGTAAQLPNEYVWRFYFHNSTIANSLRTHMCSASSYVDVMILRLCRCFFVIFHFFPSISVAYYSHTINTLSSHEMCYSYSYSHSYACISLPAFMCLYLVVRSFRKAFLIFCSLCVSIYHTCVFIAVPVPLDSSSRGLTYRIDAARVRLCVCVYLCAADL